MINVHIWLPKSGGVGHVSLELHPFEKYGTKKIIYPDGGTAYWGNYLSLWPKEGFRKRKYLPLVDTQKSFPAECIASLSCDIDAMLTPPTTSFVFESLDEPVYRSISENIQRMVQSGLDGKLRWSAIGDYADPNREYISHSCVSSVKELLRPVAASLNCHNLVSRTWGIFIFWSYGDNMYPEDLYKICIKLKKADLKRLEEKKARHAEEKVAPTSNREKNTNPGKDLVNEVSLKTPQNAVQLPVPQGHPEKEPNGTFPQGPIMKNPIVYSSLVLSSMIANAGIKFSSVYFFNPFLATICLVTDHLTQTFAFSRYRLFRDLVTEKLHGETSEISIHPLKRAGVSAYVSLLLGMGLVLLNDKNVKETSNGANPLALVVFGSLSSAATAYLSDTYLSTGSSAHESFSP